MKEEFKVTPWEVKGDVDYVKLIEEFGTEKIDKELLDKIEQKSGKLHLFLRRGFFYSHRDFDKILSEYGEGEEFFLYTGRGPSGSTHLGHLIPYLFTKHLQDIFKVKVFFEVTDDEKFLNNSGLDLNKVSEYAYENILDFIACGFDPENTVVIKDIANSRLMYEGAVQISKHVTLSTAKAVFGFTDSSNIGICFFPAIQAVPAFLPFLTDGKRQRCLIPCAIDQDPYWRVARDVAPKIGLPKPAAIFCKFLPSLIKGGKMSSSDPNSAIYVTDSEEQIKKKVMNIFTGGRETIKEQREKGGNPNDCIVYHYLYQLFEEDDGKMIDIYTRCQKGDIACFECKKSLLEHMLIFLGNFKKEREKAKKNIDRFLMDANLAPSFKFSSKG